MSAIIYAFLWLACTFILCLFSFWIGRCARRLPIIDDNLPWTMSRDQTPRCVSDCKAAVPDRAKRPRFQHLSR